MLTSRLFGRHPGDVAAVQVAPMPRVGSSKPAIMRIVVVLPQPGRAEHREELALIDHEVDAGDRGDDLAVRGELLGHADQFDRRRRRSVAVVTGTLSLSS